MANSTDQIDRAGMHAVAQIFTRLKWIFREQPTSDYGIDAQAEKLNPDGQAGGKLIALQIKTGASYFRKRGDEYVFYGEARHREYWTNHSLPVFLILHNPDTGVTLWQRIERHLIEDGKDGRWAIGIPTDQTLDENHERYIAAGVASDLPSLRRARLALDLPLIMQFAGHSRCYLRIEDWVNKTLNFRGAEVVFSDDPDDEADLSIDAWMPAYTIEYYMAVFFPWLDWSLHEYIGEEEGSNEVAVHILEVELSAVGKATLLLEDFYRSELPPFTPALDESFHEVEWEAVDADDIDF
ncbi:DUF4365 domain-containing protein [Pelagibius marinus]|uniref:DUF4365 domain-containing protein n=1 Tax=Pelagibius marinus TaxID=2762760 RepID=UPI001872F227|nr:DUF4365 domain-containing protein [Pelagibius marinus]